MLNQQTPIGVWSDEMPPINLINYPMKNLDDIKRRWASGQTITMSEYGLMTQEDFGRSYADNGKAAGTKFDSEKPRMDLVDLEAVEGLAAVLTFGARKYAAHNWRGGIAYSRIISSLLRHLSAIQRGEDVDPESGLPHIDHVGCNWMFLSYFMKNRPDLDDRYKGQK